MKFGVTFGVLRSDMWIDAAVTAHQLGGESTRLPEHLVLPVDTARSPYAGSEHPSVPPTTKLFEPSALLSFVAARTEGIRLGPHASLLEVRHPFSTARVSAPS